MKNWKLAKDIIIVVSVVGVLAFAMVTCTQAVRKDNARANAEAAADSEQYGVAISPHQGRKCLNGWLIVKIGVQAWVYPRDAFGDLIPCE